MKKNPPYYNEAPKPVKEYYQKLNSADRFIHKREHIHYQAISSAMEQLYDGEELRTDKLSDNETRDKFIDSLKEFFTRRYEKDTGISPRTADSALAHYTGKASSTLEQMMEHHISKEGVNIKSLYSLITMHQTREGPKEYNETLRDNMYNAAGAHLKEEHLDDILKFLNKEGAVDRHINKDKMNLDYAKELLQVYRDNKSISKDDISKYYRERGHQHLPEYIKQHEGQVPEEGEMSQEMEETPEKTGEKQLLQDSIRNNELSDEELWDKLQKGGEDGKAVEEALLNGQMTEEKQQTLVNNILEPPINRFKRGEEGSQQELEKYLNAFLNEENNISPSVKKKVSQLKQQLENAKQQAQQRPEQPPQQHGRPQPPEEERKYAEEQPRETETAGEEESETSEEEPEEEAA